MKGIPTSFYEFDEKVHLHIDTYFKFNGQSSNVLNFRRICSKKEENLVKIYT